VLAARDGEDDNIIDFWAPWLVWAHQDDKEGEAELLVRSVCRRVAGDGRSTVRRRGGDGVFLFLVCLLEGKEKRGREEIRWSGFGFYFFKKNLLLI
jgi:hypothetical protein